MREAGKPARQQGVWRAPARVLPGPASRSAAEGRLHGSPSPYRPSLGALKGERVILSLSAPVRRKMWSYLGSPQGKPRNVTHRAPIRGPAPATSVARVSHASRTRLSATLSQGSCGCGLMVCVFDGPLCVQHFINRLTRFDGLFCQKLRHLHSQLSKS